jgi:hypothetical protein
LQCENEAFHFLATQEICPTSLLTQTIRLHTSTGAPALFCPFGPVLTRTGMLKLIFLLASVYLGDARAESETEGLAHLDNIFKRSKGINDLSLNPKMYRSESFYYEL